MPLNILLWGSIVTSLFVVFSFLLLIWKYSHITDWGYFQNLDFKYLLFAVFLFFLYHTFDMLRLKTIAKGYKIDYPYSYAYATSFIATYGATVTPAHIGGEFIIFYMLKRLGVKTYKIWGTILFKTVSGFSFFLVAFPVFLIYTVSSVEILKKVLILFGIFAIFSVLSIPLIKWVRRYEDRGFQKNLKLYCYALLYFWKKKKSYFIKACLYSIMLYLTFLSFAPVLLKAFHVKFDLLHIYLLQLPLVYAIFSSPTPGGSGVGELGGAAIFNGVIPPSVIGLFVILWRFFSQYLGATIGGFLFTYYLLEDLKNQNEK